MVGRLFVAASIVLGSTSAAAAPCAVGTLASYIALGATGCTVGAASFEAFSVVDVPFGSTEVSPADVLVTPLASPTPGLTFQFDLDAAAGDLFEILVAYEVSAPVGLRGVNLAIEGSSATGDGVVTAVEDLCLGGSFGSGSVIGCDGIPETLIVFDIDVERDVVEELFFAPVSSIGVVKDIAVDGGLEGTAALASASNAFHLVPEPSSVSLLSAGALGLASWRRLRRERSRSS